MKPADDRVSNPLTRVKRRSGRALALPRAVSFAWLLALEAIFILALIGLGVQTALAASHPVVAGLDVRAAQEVPAAPAPSTQQSTTGAPIAQTTARAGAANASDVDITLYPSRNVLYVGDLWSVSGEIRNRSKDQPIWVVDKKTALMFSSEIYGQETDTFTLIADFATVFYDPSKRYKATSIRIDPGASYAVTWRFTSP